MTTRVRVSLGNERSDRPHGWRVVASGVVGLVSGLLLMLTVGRSLAPSAAPTAVPPAAIAPAGPDPELEAAAAAVTADDTAVAARLQPSEPAAAPVGVEPVAPAEPVAVATTDEIPDESTVAGSAAASATPSEPTAAPVAAAIAPAPSTVGASLELVRGQIAYLRCDGVPLQEGPFPCPRDRRFEKQVWSAVERLQQCPLPAPAGGDVELRVEFRTRGRKSFEVQRADASEAFASAARTCLAADLELVRTQLRPLMMTVAFRFELR